MEHANVQEALALAQALRNTIAEFGQPPAEPERSLGQFLPMTLVRDTRGYIETVANQVNGTYEKGWYDASAVMLRRLIETLIIEVFEHHHLADSIKTSEGEFLYLRELIGKTLGEGSWNLGRACKRALPRLKDIGDRSAHSRRYSAHRRDLDSVADDVRMVVQELIYLAELA